MEIRIFVRNAFPTEQSAKSKIYLRLETGTTARLFYVSQEVGRCLCRRSISIGIAQVELPTNTIRARQQIVFTCKGSRGRPIGRACGSHQFVERPPQGCVFEPRLRLNSLLHVCVALTREYYREKQKSCLCERDWDVACSCKAPLLKDPDRGLRALDLWTGECTREIYQV